MKHIDPKKIYCVGCTACATICPVEAITMHENREGFYEPVVDVQKCAECGNCVKVCPAQNLPEKTRPLAQYAGWHNDETVRYNSTSGGIFASLAKEILSQNGIVYGAVYGEDFTEVHHASTDEVALLALQKSKYAVSNLRDSFQQIQQHCKNGRKVLFVGTPCQCAGLRKIVGQDPNVLLVDFICGGTPSAKAFREYINYKKRKSGSDITAVDFRGKDTGWKKQYFYVAYTNGKKENTFYLYDPFFALFYIEHLTTRRACAQCSFRNRHVSDLTIADFWGYRNANIPVDDKGLSLVAVNTELGAQLLDTCSDKTLFPLTYPQIDYAYQDFPNPQNMLEKKSRFMEDLRENDFTNICHKYIKTDRWNVFWRRVASKLKRH